MPQHAPAPTAPTDAPRPAPAARPSRGPTRPSLAVVDMSGTSIVESGLQDRAFARALAEHGVAQDDPRMPEFQAAFRLHRRTSRTAAFRAIIPDRVEAAEATKAFERHLDALVAEHGATPQPGASEALQALRDQGLALCLTTGYARHTQNTLLDSLGWMGLADLSLCPDDAGRGVPYPDMILTALLALDLDDVRSVVTVGDTTADVQAGLRAGAGLVVGVLSGEDDEATLRGAGADAVVPGLADVPPLVAGLSA